MRFEFPAKVNDDHHTLRDPRDGHRSHRNPPPHALNPVYAALRATLGKVQGALIPDSNSNKPIEGGLANPGSITVAENTQFDTVIMGSDYDTWHYQANILSKVVKGNSAAVGLLTAGLGGNGSGPVVSTTVSDQTESTITLLVVRRIYAANLPASDYPLARADNYRLYDKQVPNSQRSSPYDVLYDGNVVNFTKVVSVTKAL